MKIALFFERLRRRLLGCCARIERLGPYHCVIHTDCSRECRKHCAGLTGMLRDAQDARARIEEEAR